MIAGLRGAGALAGVPPPDAPLRWTHVRAAVARNLMFTSRGNPAPDRRAEDPLPAAVSEKQEKVQFRAGKIGAAREFTGTAPLVFPVRTRFDGVGSTTVRVGPASPVSGG
jgi:hypothetical protein